MKKILFVANFKNDKFTEEINSCLFRAICKLAEDYRFYGICKSERPSGFTSNTIFKKVNLNCNENLWKNTVLPLMCLFNKNVPIYFPNANVSGLLPYSTPVITMIKDILPLELSEYFVSANSEKNYRRQLQTDINRSDLVFVPTEYIKTRLCEEFHISSEPVVLNFASLISPEYLDLPLGVNSERYFFVETQNVSPEGLNELLKIFIYLHTKAQNSAKLYLAGDIKFLSQELLINLDVAQKLGVLREYENLSSPQRASLLKGAIAAILPSRIDAFPIAHLDAMRCSCPIVTDETPSVKEVCQDCAVYANIYDMDSYCDNLTRLEQDNEYRKDLIYKGLYREKNFSWEHSAQIFVENLELISEK